MAERILNVAREHGIPEREDAALAAALGKIEVGREIPPALYRAVAEVLAFVYRLNQRMDAQP
jgi:type III secretion system FlhB-like substrate exporter